MIGRAIAFLICLMGLLLPWRLRVIFAEAIGWVVQFFYLTYYGILNYLLKELRNARLEKEDV